MLSSTGMGNLSCKPALMCSFSLRTTVFSFYDLWKLGIRAERKIQGLVGAEYKGKYICYIHLYSFRGKSVSSN